MRVVLLHDRVEEEARPDETDSLMQAQVVAAALAELGHEAIHLSVGLDLEATARELDRWRPDRVLNLVESLGRHARLIHFVPALLDALGIPYTGCPAEAMFLTSDKTLTKTLLAAHGIATPRWYARTHRWREDPPRPGRYILKPVWEDASVGLEDDAVVDVGEPGELSVYLERRARALGLELFAEAWVEGREFNLSLLQEDASADRRARVLPPAEIEFVDYPPRKPHLVGYRAKWEGESFEYQHTPRRLEFPRSDALLLEELRKIALRCWHAFDLRGYARVDLRVDRGGRPWVLEINANPCLSSDAGFAAAAACAGLDTKAVVRSLLDSADSGAVPRAS